MNFKNNQRMPDSFSKSIITRNAIDLVGISRFEIEISFRYLVKRLASKITNGEKNKKTMIENRRCNYEREARGKTESRGKGT